MEIKKSVVKNIQGNGSYDSPFGIMYKFDIEMYNGDHGECASKSNDVNSLKFKIGQEAEYEYHTGKYPKIKPYNPKYAKPAPSLTPNTDFIDSLKGAPIESNPYSQANNKAPQPQQGISNNPQIDIQKSIIMQNAFSQANSFFNIAGFSNQDRGAMLQELKDVADVIADHVLKKSSSRN